MSGIEDELSELVPDAVGGDRAALQRIIQLVHPLVLRYARSRLSAHRMPTPEDVAQEICLALATSVTKYVDRGRPFMAFVYGIAFNKVADAHRAQGRDHSNPTEDIPEQVDRGLKPEEYALEVDASNRARRLLDSLNERAREIIILRVFVGLSAEETATVMGSTAGAVRVAQHRALGSLRIMLEREEA